MRALTRTCMRRCRRAGRRRAVDPDRRRAHRAVEPATAGARACWRCRRSSTRTITRRAVRTSSIGAAGKPLETWLHYLALVPSVDPYLAAAVSLVAQRARRRRHRDGALHPRAGPDRPADRGGRGGAGGARRRRARRLRGRDARPQSAGLRSVRADPRRAAAEARATRSASASSAAAAAGRGQIALVDAVADAAASADVRRAVRPAGGAVVHARRCWKRSPRRRRAPAGASTCICWRRATSAPGPMRTIPTASCAISTASACSARA